MVVLEVIIEGLVTGTIYAALALALVLVYRMTGVINFAQGEMGMFSTFVIWWLWQHGLPVYAALAVGLVFAFVLGAAVERVVIRPVSRYGEFPVAITTVRSLPVFQRIGSLDLGHGQPGISQSVSAGRLACRRLDHRRRQYWHAAHYGARRRRVLCDAPLDQARPRDEGGRCQSDVQRTCRYPCPPRDHVGVGVCQRAGGARRLCNRAAADARFRIS